MNLSGQTAFQRSLFTDGTLLTAAGLRLQQDYDSAKRRLINRRFFGWGILSGFTPCAEGDDLLLEPGFALTSDGREILLEQPLRIPLKRIESALAPGEPSGLLCLDYQETEAGSIPRYSPGMEPSGNVPDRVLESFRLTLQPVHSKPQLPLARCLLEEEAGFLRIRQVIPIPPVFHPALPRREEASGLLELPLHRHPGEGVAYSPPIRHGLGPGPVEVRLVLQGWQEGVPCWVSGDAELFGVPIQTAVKQNPAEGSFVMAVRSRDPLLQTIRIRWIAQKLQPLAPEQQDPSEVAQTAPLASSLPPEPERTPAPARHNPADSRLRVSPEAARTAPLASSLPPEPEKTPAPARHNPADSRLRVSPEVANLKPGEQVRFCPLPDPAEGEPSFGFRVRDLDGGSIDRQGLYTAPAHEGFFQIEIFRQGAPGQHTFAYALVRT